MKSFNQVVNNEVDLTVKLDYDVSILESMGATTDNASITELFPCIAFNKGFKPSSVEDFKKFIYKLDLSSTTKSFAKSDAAAAASLIERLPNMEERFVKSKLENAIEQLSSARGRSAVGKNKEKARYLKEIERRFA